MRTILSLFLVLLFVASCGGGSDSEVMEMVEEMQDLEPENIPDPPEPQQPEPPTPVGTASCALPPLTVDSTGDPSFFVSDDLSTACALESDGTLAVTVCTDLSDSLGYVGNVVSGVLAVIDTAWADLNRNGMAEAGEVITSSLLSGNINLENNGATMSITDLRIGDAFYPVSFRGDCREASGNTAFSRYKGEEEEYVEDVDIEEALEGLEESLDGLLDLLTK